MFIQVTNKSNICILQRCLSSSFSSAWFWHLFSYFFKSKGGGDATLVHPPPTPDPPIKHSFNLKLKIETIRILNKRPMGHIAQLRNQFKSICFCLFGFYRPTREFFTHLETSPLPVKGFKFFTYARHSWPLSSEGSLACHTYCDTVHPFIMVIFEDPWHSHLLSSV